MEEKQHITAALNTKVGPASNKYIHKESRAQSVLQHLEEEFRAELEEKQHLIAALNTKVGPGTSEIYSRVGFSAPRQLNSSSWIRIQSRAGGEATHHCSTQH